MPGVDDDVVLHVVNIQAAVDHLREEYIVRSYSHLPHLSLSDGHPVVVHLVEGEVSVSMQGLATPY